MAIWGELNVNFCKTDRWLSVGSRVGANEFAQGYKDFIHYPHSSMTYAQKRLVIVMDCILGYSVMI